MFFQKYKGLILAVAGAVIYMVTTLYFKDLEYGYRVCIKIFAAIMIIVGGIMIEDSNRFYKKQRDNNV
ncbi:hypothetical protein ACIGHG_15135 [Bacillus sp. NPDC077411]|uniref:hypothetical protein n=1 Tax=unclassified Bacillus (in: firmicutes) TaxID=185979 RepID=UPI0008E9681D|nr:MULTISPECIES: hypothetical protein [unclassified Bacillus (in: firmicutes)]SFJ84228.1 hypothetical protein SAMN04488574_13022 [Bacillus sp. 71mf]SFT17762.1 hypothetical protein SAMN04488145_11669 [Bacillus sp. 103mf]